MIPVKNPNFEIPNQDDFAQQVPKDLNEFQLWPKATFFGVASITLLFVSLFTFFSWGWNFNSLFSISNHELFAEGNLWKPLTALLVHANAQHLLSNLLPLGLFSWLLHGYFGWIGFPIAPIFIGILSNITTVYFYEPQISLLGSSGMIYGMIAMWLILYIKHEAALPFGKKTIRVIGFALLMLLPSGEAKNVSHLAHFSGFVWGSLFSLGLLPYLKVKPNAQLFQINLKRKLNFYSKRRFYKIWTL